MGEIGRKRCTNHKTFIPMAFHLEENLAVFYIDETDSIVVCGDHHTVRHCIATHELDASHLLAF